MPTANNPQVANQPYTVPTNNLDANTMRQLLQSFLDPIKNDTDLIAQETHYANDNIEEILAVLEDIRKFLKTDLEKTIKTGVKDAIKETDLIPKLSSIENILNNSLGNINSTLSTISIPPSQPQNINISTNAIQNVLQQGLSDLNNTLNQINTNTLSQSLGGSGGKGLGESFDLFDKRGNLNIHNNIQSLLRLGSLYAGGNISNKALEVQRITQKTGTAMVGLANSSREVTNQLRERVKFIVEESQGLVNVVEAAEAQNVLYEKGISSLKIQKDLLKVAANSAEEMNMQFNNVVELAGDISFNLKLSGKQVTSIIRGASGVSKQFGISAKHVIQIQEGSKEIFENMRKVVGASSRAVNEITKLMSALETERGATEFVNEITKTFTGGFNAWQQGLDNLGVTGARMMQELRNLGLSTADIIQGRIEPDKINQAMNQVLNDIYRQALAAGESADIIVQSLTGGSVKGIVELENTLIGFNKNIKQSGQGILNEINKIESQILTTLDPDKILLYENQIKQLKDTLVNDLSASFSDLETSFQRTLDVIQLRKDQGEQISSTEIADKLLKNLNKQKTQIGNQIQLAINTGIQLEGINTDTISNIENRLTELSKGNIDSKDLLGDISSILNITQAQNEQIAKEQSKLSIKNAIDQIEAGKNLGQKDLLSLQLFALDTVTGLLQNILRVLTYVAFGYTLLSVGKEILDFVGKLATFLPVVLTGKKASGFLSGATAKAAGAAGQTAQQAQQGTQAAAGQAVGTIKNINFTKIALTAAKGFLLGAAALVILTPALIALGTAILYLGNATANLLGITPAKAQKMADNILGILSAASSIGLVIAGMSAALIGIGYLAKMPSMIGHWMVGAAALTLMTPVLIYISNAILVLGNAITDLYGLNEEKTKIITDTLLNVLTGAAKIGLAVAGLSAILAGIGYLSLITPIIPFMIAGAIALTLFTPVLISLASTLLYISNTVLNSFNTTPEKIVNTAENISNILWSYMKIATAVIVSSVLLTGLAPFAPAAVIVGALLLLGSQVLESLTYSLISAAASLVNTSNSLMNSLNIDPKKVARLSSDIASIIWSMAKITTGVIIASGALAGLGVANFISKVLFIKPIMNSGAKGLKELTGSIIEAAGAVFNIANKISNKLGINPKVAKDTAENVAGIIGGMSTIISAVNQQRKDLVEISKVDIKDVSKNIKIGSEKISLIMEDVINASMFIGTSVGKVFNEKKITLNQVNDSISLIKEMTKMLFESKRFLQNLDRSLGPFVEPKGIFRYTKIDKLKESTKYFSDNFKEIISMVHDGFINPVVGKLPLNDLKDMNSKLNQLTPLLRTTSVTLRAMDNIFGGLTDQDSFFSNSLIENIKNSTQKFSSSFGIIIDFVRKGLIDPLKEVREEFLFLDNTIKGLASLLNSIKSLPQMLNDLDIISSGQFINQIRGAIQNINEQLAQPQIITTTGIVPEIGQSQFPVSIDKNTPINVRNDNTSESREMFGINQDTTELVQLVKKIVAALENKQGTTRQVNTISGRKSLSKVDTGNILGMGQSHAQMFGNAAWSSTPITANGNSHSDSTMQ